MVQESTMKNYVLSDDEVTFFNEHGYLRLEAVFSPAEVDVMAEELDWQIDNWAGTGPGWRGEWRKVYMDDDTERRSKLTALHDLHRYSTAWCDAVTNKRLAGSIADLLGENVELHHTTLHAKPPETGHPFPMHQDWAFYRHEDGRYIDCLVHLDDTSDENGCIRFLDGSHKGGVRKHITRFPDGSYCEPHLPTDQYSLDDTVPVPAKRGDVVIFHLHMIHGSRINQTDRVRRLVRMGYRDPENVQLGGQSKIRPGLMVWGRRPRTEGQMPFSTEI